MTGTEQTENATVEPARPAATAPFAGPSPAPLRGGVAGFVGTGAMTLAQYAYQRASGSPSSSTPARGADVVLGKLGLGLSRKQKQSPAVTNLVHLGYGTGWGVIYSLLAAKRPFTGVGFGAGVWGAGLAIMPALGVGTAPWRQDPRGLVSELAFHLVYGSAVSATDRALRGEAADPVSALAPLGLGVANGMRTMTPPALVALRRPGTSDKMRAVLVAAALAEMGFDKHPDTPSRSGLQGLPGRAVAGATVGWFAGDADGSLIAGSSAVASGVAMEALRGRLAERFDLPDAALGVAEDAIAVALSYVSAARLQN